MHGLGEGNYLLKLIDGQAPDGDGGDRDGCEKTQRGELFEHGVTNFVRAGELYIRAFGGDKFLWVSLRFSASIKGPKRRSFGFAQDDNFGGGLSEGRRGSFDFAQDDNFGGIERGQTRVLRLRSG
jgi:hypothetical protein